MLITIIRAKKYSRIAAVHLNKSCSTRNDIKYYKSDISNKQILLFGILNRFAAFLFRALNKL